MIHASAIELRAGARLLLDGANLRVGPGDRVGLVGRNGAGKTTLMKVLAGVTRPAAGDVVTGEVGYLPQDPGAADGQQSALARIMSARALDAAVERMRKYAARMEDPQHREQAMRRYANAEAEFLAQGGYAAEAEALAVADGLGLGADLLRRELGTLSGGQRRRVELARILFAGDGVLLLDEPTNHLDADSISWLRGFLGSYSHGVVVISHDVDLLRDVVTRVAHLDATRCALDVYNMGWDAYQTQIEVDTRRRKREQANASKQAGALRDQAERMRAKATKARQAQTMLRRADALDASVEPARQQEKVAALRFPEPKPCGKVPITAQGLSKSYGSQEVFVDVDLAVDRGARVVVLGLNGAGKTTLLRILAGELAADTGQVQPGHGLVLGYYAQEHETLDQDRTVLDNLVSQAPDLTHTQARSVLGRFLFSADAVFQRAQTLSGGEKTRLALACLVVSGANVLLLDEPTNNLDPASRAEILDALREYEGAVILVTHDPGAVTALDPQRVLLLPDGAEDLWDSQYLDLVTLA
ncbi:MAG: ATP-binding cassette domain-containing protein [Candidatus Nanopelagicales bacterium]|nr:ATP-binding cassette domain-containing protein [Candidatus Nanopelagicales bacterium]